VTNDVNARNRDRLGKLTIPLLVKIFPALYESENQLPTRNQLPAEALGTLLCKPNTLKKRVRNVINEVR